MGRQYLVLALALMLSACGGPADPLGINDMLDRCKRAAEEGKRDFAVPPFLPVFGCRV